MTRVLIIAHGVSTDVAGSMAGLDAVASNVAAHLDPCPVMATAIISAPDTIRQAVEKLAGNDGPVLVYPHFMTSGWFVSRKLPMLLAETGLTDYEMLTPFGIFPDIDRIIIDRAKAAFNERNMEPGASDLVLVAHGSGKNPAVFDAMEAMVAGIADQALFRRVTLVHLEQAPFLEEAAFGDRDGICLPLFALTGGHVRDDIPPGLASAEFTGSLLSPIGESDEAAAAIAVHLTRHLS